MHDPSSPIRATSRLDALIELLLIALLIFMPAAFGAVDAWSESVATSIGAAIALSLAIRLLLRRGRPQLSAWAWGPIVLFIAVVLFQLFPLPAAMLRTLSPQTAEIKTDL